MENTKQSQYEADDYMKNIIINKYRTRIDNILIGYIRIW